MRVLLLDDEAVAALRDPAHAKHRVVVAHLQALAARRARRDPQARVCVATAVRVEAGWDRTAPTSAALDRLRVADVPLDAAAADVAASIVADLHVSVADAHTGAAIRALGGGDVVVLTSDPGGMVSVAGPATVRVVRI